MGVFATKLGPLFVWQALVLAVVAVGAGAVAYVGFGTIDSGGSGALAEDEQLVPAQIGDLISLVSTDGTLSFPTVETAAFETNGTVGEVLVAEGDSVEAGQALATLDAPSLTAKQLTVARDEVDLRDANDKLADALEPADAQAIAKAENDIAKAELSLENAQNNLAALVDVAQAETNLADAQKELIRAQANLALDTNEWDGKVADALSDQNGAEAAYLDAFYKWLGLPGTSVDTSLAPTAVLASVGADLSVLFPATQSDTDFYSLEGTIQDDPATAWSETTIFTFINFFPGAITGDCGTSIPPQGTCVSAELGTVWDTLETKRTALATTQLNAAKNIDSATTPVTKAIDDLATAQQTLADLNAANDTTAISVARASVAVALADVDDAKQSLIDLSAPADDKDIEVLRQQVAAAENDLATSKATLVGTTLVAPIAGVITNLDMFSGDTATGNQSGSITITDQSIVSIEGTIDEIDVLSISEGVLAGVSLTALPGQTLRGTVSEIGSPTNNQGVVTFPVSITVDVPSGLELREGLSATASVVISQQLDVLRVPTSAIRGSFLEPTVRVSSGNGVVERAVDLGSSDDFWVIVTAGLTEGEQVVMPAPSASSLEFGAIQFGGANAQQFLRQLQAGGGGGRRGQGGTGGGGNGGGGNGGNNR